MIRLRIRAYSCFLWSVTFLDVGLKKKTFLDVIPRIFEVIYFWACMPDF